MNSKLFLKISNMMQFNLQALKTCKKRFNLSKTQIIQLNFKKRNR